MFQSHLCSIFDLRRTAAEKLARSSCSHCTGHSDFPLASDIRTGYGSIVLHNIADDTGSCKSVDNLQIAELVSFLEMIEHTRNHTARSTGRSSHDFSAGSIFLADCQCIGIYKSTCLEGFLVTGRLDIVGRSLAGQMKRAWKHTFTFNAPLYRLLHRHPDFLQIIPDFSSLASLHILPVVHAIVLTPTLDIRQTLEFIHIVRSVESVSCRLAFRQCAASHTVNCPVCRNIALLIQ